MGIWKRCNFNSLTPEQWVLYHYNDKTTTDVSASNKYNDTRRGPHLNLGVQKSLHKAQYISQNVNHFQARFCHHLWKIRLFIFLPWKLVCWNTYCISQALRCTFSPEKCDLNSTCVWSAEGKYYFPTYKYPYIYYTTSLSWDSEICFQIMRSGMTACEWLTFLSWDLH
jgi:hypothetical protein